MDSPDPQRFNPKETLTKTNRHDKRSMGLDIKSNQKMISMTPGPADYNIQEPTRPVTMNQGHKAGWSSALCKHNENITNDNTQVMINSTQYGKYYQSPKDGMYSRKPGRYP